VANWKLGRLWQTLTYFEIIPIINFWQRLGKRSQAKSDQDLNMVILVAGATGGVGKRVTQRLIAGNYRVRALVRDAARAKEIFGSQVELFEADLTIAQTLKPEMKVQPVEGDTPTREKYYQGIKFYLPEVVDVPELVEYEGIKNLIQVVSKYLPAATGKILFDFTNPNADIKETWGAVDDVVMGGVSQSNIRLADQRAFFSGIVSTDNNGMANVISLLLAAKENGMVWAIVILLTRFIIFPPRFGFLLQI